MNSPAAEDVRPRMVAAPPKSRQPLVLQRLRKAIALIVTLLLAVLVGTAFTVLLGPLFVVALLIGGGVGVGHAATRT